ncbi:MAG: sugar phosphate isomerase/epimerase [Bacilli bacterium]|nr:sugar phosphate isomerase/epimerase [Bacilli bacterium]
MKIGLCSVSFRKLSVDEIIALAKKANLEAIEWGADVHCPFTDLKLCKEVGEKTRANNLLTYSYGTYFRCKDVNEFKKISEAAKALGASVIRVWAGEKWSNEFSKEEFTNMVNVIKECADIAKVNQQTICFEYHHHTFNDYKESSLALIKAINKDNVKTYWQTQYWDDKSTKEDNHKHNLESLKALKEYIVNFHVYNWVGYLDRRPLIEIKNEMKEYLSFANIDSVAYLEFFKNDDPNECYQDAKTLKNIVKELKQGE